MEHKSDINSALNEFEETLKSAERRDNSMQVKNLINFHKKVITQCNKNLDDKIKVTFNESPIHPSKNSVSNTISIFSKNLCLSSGAIYSTISDETGNVSTQITCDGPAGSDGRMYTVNCLKEGKPTALDDDVDQAAIAAAMGVIVQAKKIIEMNLH